MHTEKTFPTIQPAAWPPLEARPSAAARAILWSLLAMLFASFTWSLLAEIDVVAVAQGKIVTKSNLQIVQPAETGIVRELLVREGETVRAQQIIARMDMRLSEADSRQMRNELQLKRLQLRRIEAELSETALRRASDDPSDLFEQVTAQYQARRQAHLDAMSTERALLVKAEQDLKGAAEVEAKLRQTLPIYRQQEQAFEKLNRDGFAGRLMLLERQRDRIEKEQDLAAQQFAIASLNASISQIQQRLAQIRSNYRQQLQNERVEAEAQYQRLLQDWEKLATRQALLELRAPQDGIVKDLATKTIGSVIAAGTVLMTIMPQHEPLQAEVWVTNQDAGFVEPGQKVKLKLLAYPFQKYGMLEGEVAHLSPDSSDLPQASYLEKKHAEAEHVLAASGYRTLVTLGTPFLERGGRRYRLSPGMQVAAEIHLGTRTVMEYLVSPVQKTVLEAGRER